MQDFPSTARWGGTPGIAALSRAEPSSPYEASGAAFAALRRDGRVATRLGRAGLKAGFLPYLCPESVINLCQNGEHNVYVYICVYICSFRRLRASCKFSGGSVCRDPQARLKFTSSPPAGMPSKI